MKQNFQQKHTIDVLFLLLLFAMFSITSLLVVLIGANTYKKTVATLDQNYEYRTLVSYLNEKVRQNNDAGTISIETLEDTCVLVLTQDYDGVPYSTCLYQYDGSIRETLISSTENFTLTSGQEVLSASSFTAEYASSDLLKITVTGLEDATYEIYLSSRSLN